MFQLFIQKTSSGEILTREEARLAMELLLSGEISDIEIAALLIALRTRGETTEELIGFLEAMHQKMKPVYCKDKFAVDLCGTGGDGSGSFNISTAASLVAAAAGVTVAKHGNRAISSQSGSADFLEALGYQIKSDSSDVERELELNKFTFLFAPHFHPAAKAAAGVRKQLGVRTVFNLLGPLANPARVKRQMVGVFHKQWIEPLAQTLAHCGSTHTLVIHGSEGIDEISAYQETFVCEYRDGHFAHKVLTPADFDAKPTSLAEIHGSSAKANAQKFLETAEGKHEKLREWIVVNAAPAFYLADKVSTLKEGAELARETISSGKLAALINSICKA